MGLLKLAGDAIRAAHTVEKIEYAPRDAASNDIIVYRHEIENFGKAARLQVAPNQVAIFVNDGEYVISSRMFPEKDENLIRMGGRNIDLTIWTANKTVTDDFVI